MRFLTALAAAGLLALLTACTSDDADGSALATSPAGTPAGTVEADDRPASATATAASPPTSGTPSGLLDELLALAAAFEQVDVWGDGPGEVSFVTPNGLTIDDEGSIYVTDFQFGQLRKLDADGSLVFKAAEAGPQPGQLANPIGVAVARDGSILVSESGASRVTVFDADGSFRTTFGEPGRDPGMFRSAMGIAISEQDEVFVADFGNHRVQVFTTGGGFLRSWGEVGTVEGQFNNPIGLQIGPAGNVWVVDSGNERVQVFNQAGELVRVFDDVGPGPQVLSINTAGEFFVASPWVEGRVRHFSPDGELLGHLGNSVTEAELSSMSSGERERAAELSTLAGPHGTATDPSGTVYLADTANGVVRKFEPTGR